MKRATSLKSKTGGQHNISIHALMKRATLSIYRYYHYTPHFNPRPHEEGDCKIRQGCRSRQNFNPRPHEEGDNLARSRMRLSGISIHALMKRATGYKIRSYPTNSNFNPRPHEEGDGVQNDIFILSEIFQSTPS